MADLNGFVKRLNGRKVDFDGAYGAQCVDLVKRWESDNQWPVVRGNAIQVPRNAPKDFYEWVPNGMLRQPNPGDIVVFDLAYPFGHIGICTSASVLGVECFEQNNPVGSACRKVYHPMYRKVIGWLKPKGARLMNDDQWKDLIWRIAHHVWRVTHGMAFPDDNSIRREVDQGIEEYRSGRNQWWFSDLINRWFKGQ